MKPIYIKEVIKACNGEIVNGSDDLKELIQAVSTDTRADLRGKLFVPLKGIKYDGHDYINNAFEKGAVAVLTEKRLSADISNPYILVESTYEALKSLAEYYRSLFNIKVVGITGSSGKTTSKELIASVLSQKFNTIKTEGNLNNEIGLPLTVFNIEEDTEVAVLEMGMNSFGEIHNLSKIAKPDICVITNIGEAHIENLGSKEGILKAKTEIFDFMAENGHIILNGDDDMLVKLKDTRNRMLFVGMNKSNEIYAENIQNNGIEAVSFDIKYGTGTYSVNINAPGEHMVRNSLMAAAVGHMLNIEPEHIIEGLQKFRASDMRMNIIKKNGLTILNDVYNANPSSMRSSLDVLSKAEGRKVCILGDMLELGENSESYHYELGLYAVNKGIDTVITVGNYSKEIYRAVKSLGSDKTQAEFYCSKKHLINDIAMLIHPGDTVLVKASRGMGFEEIIEKLTR